MPSQEGIVITNLKLEIEDLKKELFLKEQLLRSLEESADSRTNNSVNNYILLNFLSSY